MCMFMRRECLGFGAGVGKGTILCVGLHVMCVGGAVPVHVCVCAYGCLNVYMISVSVLVCAWIWTHIIYNITNLGLVNESVNLSLT